MNNPEVEKLLKEHSDINELEAEYNLFIDNLKAEQSLIKQVMEEVNSWKAGNAQEAFMSELEDYHYQYTMKIVSLEEVYREIGRAEKKVRNLINSELNKGPKF
ncbi:hypothetical protein [Bacillus sp. V2I10]|uniref:hypothetical protein n=1 Tax=Bacillus sp. V2I10 TaxID=3042276 RepID=UPI0027854E06|nr:hypothetical protein [Bacillus sp. V2I10]MDQ0861957.1 hypothetical protein [Bacillus sp. V2I10]